jgi:hypothetical protein
MNKEPLSSEDRLMIIKYAQEKINKRKKAALRKIIRAQKEGNRGYKAEAGDVDVYMTDTPEATRAIIENSGIMETFTETTKLDNQWN